MVNVELCLLSNKRQNTPEFAFSVKALVANSVKQFTGLALVRSLTMRSLLIGRVHHLSDEDTGVENLRKSE